MRLTDFLEDLGNPVAYYPKLARITGGVLPNLFLCQMYYWLGKQKDDEGWIYKTQIEIEEETGLTRKEQESARKSLKARGLLKEQFKGCPRRLEFWLDKEALNTSWEAYVTDTELPIQEVPKAWIRKSKPIIDTPTQKSRHKSKPTHNAPKEQYILPNSCNIECPDSTIYNTPKEQYILHQSSITECPDSADYNAPSGQAIMPYLGNISIYTEITSEITTQEAPPKKSAPSTQDLCVCEDESIWDIATQQTNLVEIAYLEETTPQLPASLLKKSESLQQSDNSSCGSTIPVRSFDKSEQSNNKPVAPNPKSASPTSLPDSTCYTMHPTEKTEQAMRKSGLPSWMEKAGPNGWKAEFVESYRQYLSSTPRYAKELVREATTGEAKNALTRLSKTDSGTAEIQNHWDSFNELKQRQEYQQPKQPHHSSDDALAKAIAADEERRRQEQSKQEPKNEYRFSPEMLELKAKREQCDFVRC